MRIGEMSPEHLAHCLAMIMRKLREDPDNRWALNHRTGRVKLVRRGQV